MTNNQGQERKRITGGPSREELFDALRLRGERRKVSFTLLTGWTTGGPKETSLNFTEKLLVWVNGLSIEDGSGNRWLFSVVDPKTNISYEGYFDIVERKGWVEKVAN